MPAGSDVRFWSWNDYLIEELWDYGFIEVSTDDGDLDPAGGARRGRQRGLHRRGPERQAGRPFGDLENGLTGTTGGYRHDWVNLTPYAGTTIQLRLRYATDAAFEERGWFADDFSVTADGTAVWTDDVESGENGWTAERRTFTNTSGAGWVLTSGTFDYEQYYLPSGATSTATTTA